MRAQAARQCGETRQVVGTIRQARLRVVHPEVVWALELHRPNRLHMRETCDGVPRVIETDYGSVGLAACGEWLGTQLDVAPDPATLTKCPRCLERVRQLGGMA